MRHCYGQCNALIHGVSRLQFCRNRIGCGAWRVRVRLVLTRRAVNVVERHAVAAPGVVGAREQRQRVDGLDVLLAGGSPAGAVLHLWAERAEAPM